MCGASLYSVGQAAILKNGTVYIPSDVICSLLSSIDGFLTTTKKEIRFDTKKLLPAKEDDMSMKIANPIHEFTSQKKLEDHVGFQLAIPTGTAILSPTCYSSIDTDEPVTHLAQVFYSNPQNYDYEILFRQSIGNENNSGDYNTYNDTKQVMAGNKKVTLYGNEGMYYLAIWHDDTYSYSFNWGYHGLSEAEFINILK